MILTVGNTKGGVGKTTLAVQLAITRALTGRDVLVVDGDRQGSAQTALAMRAETGRKPALACAQYSDGRLLRDQVRHQASKNGDVVIDAGGQDSAALRAALLLSDVLLIPFQPRSVDVWALADIAALVEEVRGVRDGLQAFAVLNAADPGASNDNAEAAAALADYPQLALLEAPIRRRKAFANAVGAGLSVEELNPRDPKACEELMQLSRNAFTISDTPLATGDNCMAITKPRTKPDAGEAFIAKAADAKPGRWQRGSKTQITLSIAPELLDRVDEVARRKYVSRAALVSLWLNDRLQQEAS
jgi:chromosome partitioning protein